MAIGERSVLVAFVRRGGPKILEASVAPAVLFWVCLVFGSLGLAYMAAVAWLYGCVAHRVVRREPVSQVPGAGQARSEIGSRQLTAERQRLGCAAVEATDATDREVLTYDQFGAAARELAMAVVESGYDPDWIVAIARGGLLIGGALGYALGLKNIATINVEFYTDVDERLEAPVVLPPVLDLIDLENTRVLVVDDVADTGETLKLVVDLLRPAVAEVRSAVLYRKARSILTPDYCWRSTESWINFPWSTEPPVR